jgi:hypothetical protein
MEANAKQGIRVEFFRGGFENADRYTASFSVQLCTRPRCQHGSRGGGHNIKDLGP